jgi:hypothetical protein
MLFTVGVLSIAISGCGGGPAEPDAAQAPVEERPAAAPPASNAASPEDLAIVVVFEDATAALEAKDYGKFAGHLTNDSLAAITSQLLTAGIAMHRTAELASELAALAPPGSGPDVAGMAATVAKVSVVLEKHGVLPPDQETAPPQGDPARSNLVDAIADKPAFVGEMMAVMEEIKQTSGVGGLGGAVDDPLSGGQLEEVIIDGDTASGTVSQTVNGQSRRTPVKFQRIGGVWKIDAREFLEGALAQ